MLPKGRTSEEGGCEIRGQEKSAGTKQMYRQIGNQGKCKLPLALQLYRYAVILDMLCQIIAYQDTEWSPHELEFIRKQANVRMAKTRGNIDLKKLLDGNLHEKNIMEDYE